MEAMGTCEELMNNSFSNCTFNSTLLEENNCTGVIDNMCRNGGVCDSEPDLVKGLSILIVFIISLIGNICTILILSQFKSHKIPDVLVMGLALTDLLATFLPIALALYAYFVGITIIEGCLVCEFFGTLAHFTRYSSALIVTLVSLERYFAVNRPFIYRKYATPKRFIFILIFCWLVAFVLAVIPAIDGDITAIESHDGFCLFDLTSYYAIAILVYSAIQYVTVFLCFVLVVVELVKVYRRRKRLKVQGEYNETSKARHREHGVTFTRPNFTSRMSDLGKTIKKAAPIITEKFQWSVEAQFARMLFSVVALFYISWTTIVVMIVIAQIRGSIDGLEEALFWGIRLSIVSTAINPLLYGILARQYRLAYFYVIRLWLSKCCCCVSPPLKDVFAAARNLGGDVRDRRASQSRRDSQHSRYGTHSVGSTEVGSRFSTSNVLLTNTTQLALNITLPPRLSRIHEEMSLEPNESSIASEFTTHVPTAGELSSTVTIPHQARDHNDSSTVDLELRGAASMHDLVDAGMVELGMTKNPQPGIKNPLAVMTKMVGGEEVLISPGGSDFDSPAESPPLFSNPLYELSTRTSDQHETSLLHRQGMLAASSTDDITLLSKKKKKQVTKTLSDSPQHPPSSTKYLSLSLSGERGGSKKGRLNLKQDHETQQSYYEKKRKVSSGGNPLEKSQRKVVPATDIVSGGSVYVPSQNSRDHKAMSCSPSHQPHPPKVKIIQAHAHSKSFDSAPSASEQIKGSYVKHRNSRNAELSKINRSHGVNTLRGNFESLTKDISPHHSNGHTQHSRSTTGRSNSTENSDSGRESMVLDY